MSGHRPSQAGAGRLPSWGLRPRSSGAWRTHAGYNGTGPTFLRGIQTTDASGRVTFTTIFPGWYQGRATHIHVEVKIGGTAVKVTQIAFEESVIAAVYATGVYGSKGRNPTSNAGDMVFADSLSWSWPRSRAATPPTDTRRPSRLGSTDR
jgi:hypothetical protein